MIDASEIREIASETGLNPYVVEKDYVIGWVLAGIYMHPEICEGWVFKGGTCLKKCFFETYRFSEDLDFTLRHAEHLDEVFLFRVLSEVADWVYQNAGISTWTTRLSAGGGPADSLSRIRSGRAPRAISSCTRPATIAGNREHTELTTFAARRLRTECLCLATQLN